MRRLLVASLLTLAFTQTADAAPFTPHLNMAYKLAIAHWGEPEGCLSIDRQIVPNGSLGAARGEATVPAPGTRVPCYLYMVRELAAPRMFGTACALARHEVGHLKGADDSANPNSIMYPAVTFLPRVCSQRITWLMNHPNYGGEQ